MFRLTPKGLQLIEIAPGVDLERDILAHVAFTPIIDGEPAIMDERIFRDEPMALKEDLLAVPLPARFSYDAERNILFINMEGLSITTPEQANQIIGAGQADLVFLAREFLRNPDFPLTAAVALGEKAAAPAQYSRAW